MSHNGCKFQDKQQVDKINSSFKVRAEISDRGETMKLQTLVQVSYRSISMDLVTEDSSEPQTNLKTIIGTDTIESILVCT